jgi:hypothetical protein
MACSLSSAIAEFLSGRGIVAPPPLEHGSLRYCSGAKSQGGTAERDQVVPSTMR